MVENNEVIHHQFYCNLGQNTWKILTPPPPPPISPGSEMIKWRVLASARLQPWFFWGVGACCSIFFCPRLLHNPHPVRDAIIFPSIALPLLYRFIWMGKNNSNTLRVDMYLKRGWESEPGRGRFSENKTLYSVIILSWSGIHGIFKGCFNIDCPKESFIVVFSSAAQKSIDQSYQVSILRWA